MQNSVFECLLTEVQFYRLKSLLESIIDKREDSIRFYLLGDNWNRRIESIGKITTFAIDEELIV